MVRIPYMATPAAIAGELLVMYERSRTIPDRHFRCNPQAVEILSDLMVDRHSLCLPDDHPLWSMPGVASYEIPDIHPAVDIAIVDLSIGGPSVWSGDVADSLVTAGRNVLFISYFGNCARIGGEALPPFPNRSRVAFSHLSRCLVRLTRPHQLLLVGREMGARMVDLMDSTPTTILETGYAESCLIQPSVSEEILGRALAEILLREQSFPWDNLSHTLLASEAIRRAKCNMTWSRRVANLIRDHFPSSRVLYQPPSIQSNRFPYAEITASDPLHVAFGGGAHTLGHRGREFLAVDDVVKAVSSCSGVELTLLTSDPQRLQSHLSGARNVKTLPRLKREEMPAFMRDHEVYFRLQNDSSLPLSCVEAMSMGRIVVVNERAKDACEWLRHMENCVLAPFGDPEFLASIFQRLRADSDLVRRIGRRARSDVGRYCALGDTMIRLGFLA